MPDSFAFVTDTSTLSVFDLQCLRHRLEDEPDWWTYPPGEQITEVNNGAAAFIDLGVDGRFEVQWQDQPLQDAQLQIRLQCPGGTVFVGAGEETTSDGMEPDCKRGGRLVEVEPGTYEMRVASTGPRSLRLSLCRIEGNASNRIEAPLRLRMASA